MKHLSKLSGIFIGAALISGTALAHVVVTPAEVGVGAYQTYTMGVPVEKDIPTIAVRLVVPEGVENVTPTVKPGWTITTQKHGDRVSEISWTGGQIPAAQRDEFSFSAQAPAKPATLAWKAYQTYADGSEVAWDQNPEVVDKHDDKDDQKSLVKATPYSQTKVIDDAGQSSASEQDGSSKALSLYVSGVALMIAILAYFRPRS